MRRTKRQLAGLGTISMEPSCLTQKSTKHTAEKTRVTVPAAEREEIRFGNLPMEHFREQAWGAPLANAPRTAHGRKCELS
jgi:hypothetical protein